MTDRPELPAGTTIAEKYRVTRTLGRGGMGHVFEAEHLALGVKVAVKVLHRESDDTGTVGRFWREARAAALLESEYLARVHDYGSLPDGRPFMVMEHLDGEDLKQALSRGPMAIREAVDIACQTCAGLAHAHAAGIVHRDLKPSNLFLVRRGRHRRIKVLDFGISKLLRGDAHVLAVVETRTEALLGTPYYMAPEQVRNAKEVDPRADLWSLGVVLYEALSGGRPFEDGSLGGLFATILERDPPRIELRRPELPPALADLVHRCLEKDPAKRPADAAALATLLEPFASDEGAVAVRRARDALDVVVASSGRGFVDDPAAPVGDSTPPVGAPSSATPVSARSAPSEEGAGPGELPSQTVPESERRSRDGSSRSAPGATPVREAPPRRGPTWVTVTAAVLAGIGAAFGASAWWASARPDAVDPPPDGSSRASSGVVEPAGSPAGRVEPSPPVPDAPLVAPSSTASAAGAPTSEAAASVSARVSPPRSPPASSPPRPAASPPPPPPSASAPKRPTLR